MLRLDWPADLGAADPPPTPPGLPAGAPVALQTSAARLAEDLERYVAGAAVAFGAPLDLRRATPFRRAVWQALREVGWGERTTYGALARAAGRPRAARAAGQACGANPLPLLVPCHRALAAGERLGGWSGAPGLKERLLALEGIRWR